jgi:hypothetical protein
MSQIKGIPGANPSIISPWDGMFARSQHAPLDASQVVASYNDLQLALNHGWNGLSNAVTSYGLSDGEQNAFIGEIITAYGTTEPVYDKTGLTGPWIVTSYSKNQNTSIAYASYNADRLLTYQEQLAHFVRRYDLGSYYSGVGEWYQLTRSTDSNDKTLAKEYRDSGLSLSNPANFTYGEIFNDYTYNKALSYAHAEGWHTYAIGYASHAGGKNSLAEAPYSIAVGESVKTEGNASAAFGSSTIAKNQSISAGLYTFASSNSISVGKGDDIEDLDHTNKATNQSIAVGLTNYASGQSAAFGSSTKAENNSIAAGSSTSSDTNSIAFGTSTTAKSKSIAGGETQTQATTNSIAIGTTVTATTNSAAFGSTSDAKNTSMVVGESNKADTFSTALGTNSTATNKSLATGNYTYANQNSVAIGDHTYAQYGSVSIGALSYAMGTSSLAVGAYAIAQGDLSIAVGAYTIVSTYGGAGFGFYNGNGESSYEDHLFQIGNGTGHKARHNVFDITKNGDQVKIFSPTFINGDVDIDGTLTISGDTTIGNDKSDTLTVKATPTFNTFSSTNKAADGTTNKTTDGVVTNVNLTKQLVFSYTITDLTYTYTGATSEYIYGIATNTYGKIKDVYRNNFVNSGVAESSSSTNKPDTTRHFITNVNLNAGKLSYKYGTFSTKQDGTTSAAPITHWEIDKNAAVTYKRAQSWTTHVAGDNRTEQTGELKLWTGTYDLYKTMSIPSGDKTIYFCTKT